MSDSPEEVLAQHPDDVPPSKELKNIALRSAGSAAKAERQVNDLTSSVADLTGAVSSLRSEVSTAVKRDDLRRSQEHTLRIIFWPLLVGAVALLVMAAGVGVLFRIANTNSNNGALIVNCTQPPVNTSPKELRRKACYVRSTKATADAIRELDCTILLANAVPAPKCDDIRTKLAADGVIFPPHQ